MSEEQIPFAPGDVVETKSQAWPKMTVEAVSNGRVYCVWFDCQNKLSRDVFDPTCIRHDSTVPPKQEAAE